MSKIDIVKVRIAHKRPIHDVLVVQLMYDMERNGLRKPICLSKQGNWLRDGLHRLEAAKRLGWTEIEFFYSEDE